MNAPDFPLQALRETFKDVDLAILFDYLQLPRPAALAGIDLEETSREQLDEDALGPVRLVGHEDRDDDGRDRRLAAAVARLALSAIAERLPQWASVSAEGDVILGRENQPRRLAKVDLLPNFLFEINWADSGPGFSWPEAYHATYLPGFDRYLVTMSADSSDSHGYSDLAIGHFPAEEDFHSGVERVICDWWRCCQPEGAWAYMFEEGAIDAAKAYAWREAVWGMDVDGKTSEDDEEQ